MITQHLSLTRQFSFITTFIAISILSLGQLQAEEMSCSSEHSILERSGKSGYVLKEKTLTDLRCNDTFEGKYFKIVYGKSNEAISFKGDKKLIQRAANTYHHLMIARGFWKNKISSEFVKNKKQITVRIQITNGFSRLGHFKNDEAHVNNNNAWTIPAGETPRWAKVQDKWGQEIWFAPMKKVESRRQVRTRGNNPLTQQLRTLRDPVVNYVRDSATQSALNHIFYPTYQSTTLLNMAVRHLGSLAVMFATLESSKYMDKVFIQKYYYIDTAMIPDVIYHEYSHVALSDSLNPIHSVPVIEGMADYFATRISGTKNMYRSIKKFSANAHKNVNNKKRYSPYLEHANNASSDFTLGVLWQIKIELDKMNAMRVKKGRPVIVDPDKLIFETRKRLSSDSTILDLTQALKETCTKDGLCDSKVLGLGAITKILKKKGI